MKIFITHIQEEFPVAMVLKKWIESAFPDYCEVMVSTDPDSIPAVAQYVEKNEQALEEIKALILLCSPHSIQKPWIPFEAGCAWIRKIFIIPVCYSGISREELPQPLSIFHGFDLEQRDFGQQLFMTLAKELGVSELPAVQYRQMRQELNQVMETIQPGVADFSRPGGPRETADLPLEPFHVQILQVLNDGFGYTSTVLAEHFRTEERKILPHLKRLIEGNYVYASPAGTGHVRYNMAKRGRVYLEEHGLS